jgi:protein SCO1/2
VRRLLVPLAVLSIAAGEPASTTAVPAPPGSPAWAEGADVVEHLGAQVPLDLAFTDSHGERKKLGSLFDGVHPVLLVLAYYECPQLCSLVLDGTVAALTRLDGWGWKIGAQYRVATISFDATEQIDQAARKQASVLGKLGRLRDTAWPFFVGNADAIEKLTGALGFRFLRDPRTGSLAHAAVVFVLTPDGRISRYLYGTEIPPRDLKLALLEASDGKTGSVGDKILMRCFRYDPSTRRYGLFVARFMQVGGALIFVVVLGVVVALWRLDRRRTRGGDLR